MVDPRRENGSVFIASPGRSALLSVVTGRVEEDTGFPKVRQCEESFGDDSGTRLPGEVTVPEGTDVGLRESRRDSGGWTRCCCLPAPVCACCRKPERERESPATHPEGHRARCPGLGLLYTVVASVFFSVAALLVKKIEGIHAVEISAIRCFFQMLFVMPFMIYYRTGFIGPPGMRVYLFLRGFLGSNAMILLYYAVLQMPLADATVITFSNPVFTSLLAWIFLKERCTIWDVVFTVFTLTGVVLIARPPFLFGEDFQTVEGNPSSHFKGAAAAFGSALAAACAIVILRKIGKNVHYFLSVWYYAVLGFTECVAVLLIMDEWVVPDCGLHRWNLMAIGVLGIGGQTFLTKALQIEKAGPVSLMRTTDVVLAFILQFFFLSRQPTWWSVGGALCVISSTSGVALRKWYNSTQQKP